MQLIYLWCENYKEFNFSDGIKLTSEYYIDLSLEDKKINISKNEEYIPNFYGEKISEIIAIVGENGCGKSTVAMMIKDKFDSLAVGNNNEKSKFILIYKSKDSKEGKVELIVYYYLDYELKGKIGIDKDFETRLVNCKKLVGDNFSNEYERIDSTIMFISNVFDYKQLASIDGTGRSEFKKQYRDFAFTPASILQMCRMDKGVDFGAKKGNLVHQNINEYSKSMTVDIINEYLNFQSELFLKSVDIVPKELRSKLKIYNHFNLKVREFGAYSDITESLSDLDKNVRDIRNVYLKHKNDSGDFLSQCYFNLLCETYLFFYQNKEYQNSKVKERLEFELSREKIRINIELLNVIKEDLKNGFNNKFNDLEWVKQFDDSIRLFTSGKESNWNINIGEHNFNDENINEFLQVYLSELKNENSILRKYIIFSPMPASSGEVALANIFSYINEFLYKNMGKNITIIIDEIDALLHPRWQQSILKYLIEFLEGVKLDKEFNIVLTTHSPIILSDITNDRVIKLTKTNSTINIKNCTNKTFGASILNLYYDDFFMDKGSVGEVVKEKIKSVLGYPNNKLSLNEANYIIDSIGEEFVRRKLKNDLEKVKVIDSENNESKNILDRYINKLGYEKALKYIKKGVGEIDKD